MADDVAASSSSAVASAGGGVVLSETQLGNMALRAKQQRTKAEQDKQLLQVRKERLLLHFFRVPLPKRYGRRVLVSNTPLPCPMCARGSAHGCALARVAVHRIASTG